LSLSIQSFSKIRKSGCIYVDKTRQIYDLITDRPGTYFLSRPRRFGKSLICTTLEAIFSGRRELFGEIAGRPALAINSLDWDWKEYPVIYLQLDSERKTAKAEVLEEKLKWKLGNIARSYGVEARGDDASVIFENLIEDLYYRFDECRVVVLIDEYDHPMISSLHDADKYDQMREILKDFYGVLKGCDEYLRFVFFTGVTKFSKVGVFTGLNQPIDLTLQPEYAAICGITQEELEANFGPEIDAVIQQKGRKRESYLEDVCNYYGGYRFSKEPICVYNLCGLLEHFTTHGAFFDCWYEIGTPSFLVDLVKRQTIDIRGAAGKVCKRRDFDKWDPFGEDQPAAPVLYQTGYLTISDHDSETDTFRLDYPNTEVRTAFTESLLPKHYHRPR
jgi:hypothetical protein